jgi:hypothetical protein
VFENRVFRRMFGSRREKFTGGWRHVSNEALLNLYSSMDIIRVNKSKMMRYAGNSGLRKR